MLIQPSRGVTSTTEGSFKYSQVSWAGALRLDGRGVVHPAKRRKNKSKYTRISLGIFRKDNNFNGLSEQVWCERMQQRQRMLDCSAEVFEKNQRADHSARFTYFFVKVSPKLKVDDGPPYPTTDGFMGGGTWIKQPWTLTICYWWAIESTGFISDALIDW